MIDYVYIAASKHDARYTRICTASVRYFYPEIPIRLLIGGALQRGLADELNYYWNVTVAELPACGNYGWGFVKLEPLFGPYGERFLVLDSDTVFTGPVLDIWRETSAPFLVDDETQSDSRIKAIYYDWQLVRKVDPNASAPQFLFNTGQWFGTAGILSRNDFSPWVEWTMPRRTIPPGLFMNGEQGVLNYVLNKKATRDCQLVRCKQLMCWPGQSLGGLNAESVRKKTALPRIVHWAGMKRAWQANMAGADLLRFFEGFYYQRLRGGAARRVLAAYKDTALCHLLDFQVKIKLALRRFRSRQKNLARA